MKKAVCITLFFILIPLGFSCWAGEPTYVQGERIFIEKGVAPPHRTASWYAPMVNKPYAIHHRNGFRAGTAKGKRLCCAKPGSRKGRPIHGEKILF